MKSRGKSCHSRHEHSRSLANLRRKSVLRRKKTFVLPVIPILRSRPNSDQFRRNFFKKRDGLRNSNRKKKKKKNLRGTLCDRFSVVNRIRVALGDEFSAKLQTDGRLGYKRAECVSSKIYTADHSSFERSRWPSYGSVETPRFCRYTGWLDPTLPRGIIYVDVILLRSFSLSSVSSVCFVRESATLSRRLFSKRSDRAWFRNDADENGYASKSDLIQVSARSLDL